MIDFLLGLAVGIGACCTFAIACGLLDIHRWDRRRR